MQRVAAVARHCVGSEMADASGGETTGKASMSSHCLDTTTGKPAQGLKVTVRDQHGAVLAERATNADGRVPKDELPSLAPGEYSCEFDTSAYFKKFGVEKFFYPKVVISFIVEAGQHYHVPLLISPFGFSTYRGS